MMKITLQDGEVIKVKDLVKALGDQECYVEIRRGEDEDIYINQLHYGLDEQGNYLMEEDRNN